MIFSLLGFMVNAKTLNYFRAVHDRIHLLRSGPCIERFGTGIRGAILVENLSSVFSDLAAPSSGGRIKLACSKSLSGGVQI